MLRAIRQSIRAMKNLPVFLALGCLVFIHCAGGAQAKPRARDLGVPFDGTTGQFNAITDVKGVEVGHTTLISGSGKLKVGTGPVRTGVTAILPRGKASLDPVFGGWFSLNGNGEMTGTTWLEESGVLDGPVMITNTHSVGVVRDAVIAWRIKQAPPDAEGYSWSLPIVAETADDDLNDMNGFHVKPEHAFHALDSAHGGAAEEGNVGGGTGMICNEFKGGIGTSSRLLPAKLGGYTVGVLVQCNYGRRSQLRIAGVPVGKEIPDHTVREEDIGSIIIVVATDAPLDHLKLRRLASKAALGLARTGSIANHGSGDIFLAFSTGNRVPHYPKPLTYTLTVVADDHLDPIFRAAEEATEEAILNALAMATTTVGRDGNTAHALPLDRLVEVMKKYGRLR
jgi:D-aminopeptidase